jgi:hypothetical protein
MRPVRILDRIFENLSDSMILSVFSIPVSVQHILEFGLGPVFKTGKYDIGL